MERNSKAGVFGLLGLLIVALIVHIGVRVYLYQNYPIFTSEEEIDEAVSDEFGPVAEYL